MSLFYQRKDSYVFLQATSHKPQATSHKRSVRTLAFLASTFTLFSLSPLSAEENGVFAEAGFQYSNFTGLSKAPQEAVEAGLLTSTKTSYNGNLFGADIQIGYKQFFGGSKIFGLRYYGFFSGQGGSGSFKQQYEDDSGNSYWATIKQPAANLFYGAGVDMLYNFYENAERTYGVFAGVMLGGSSWLMGKSSYKGQCVWQETDPQGNPTNCVSMNQFYKQQMKDLPDGVKGTFSPTYVQFLVNIGFRANFTQHQGFELGVRIPTINDPYATVTGGGMKASTTFRRTVAAFANYVYNF
ncbi:outer membrane protein [Helicobacter baculiformis]|uniref:Outer membrane protein n=1 Tax=Helicobacter baculiformis TaxID=427351 RepID=A0ABV7ZHZ7_9HELI|nr:outer membrane protein [Helicobacter baculiformis]